MNLPRIVSMSLALVAVACNVSTVDPGGADPGNVPPPGGLAGDTPRPEGCTAPTEGLTVIMTDYNSSNVGLA